MGVIQAFCDRCGELIQGLEIEGRATAGFYRVDNGIWRRYANEGEAILCDKCMQNDPRYREDYEMNLHILAAEAHEDNT